MLHWHTHVPASMTEDCTLQGFSKHSMHANYPQARSKNNHTGNVLWHYFMLAGISTEHAVGLTS